MEKKQIPTSKVVPRSKNAEQEIETTGATSRAANDGKPHFKSVETDADRRANLEHIHDHACQGCPQCRNVS